MKGLSILCGAMLVLATAPAVAQNIPVSDLESGLVPWAQTSGYPTVALGTDGGAESTTNYLRITDAGWGAGWGASNIVTPTAGKYKLQFWFRNGSDTLAAMKALKIGVVQNGGTKTELQLTADKTLTWTQAETEIIDLTGDPVTITGANQQSATQDCLADLDQFVLVPVAAAPLEISVFPTDLIYLSLTKTITATPKFGSETYTKVEFDVNNDGSVEFTDTTAPFEYAWDTTVQVAMGTSRTLDATSTPPNTPLPVKITVTDSNNNTATSIQNYTIDNRFNGRASLITNGDFSQWQTADSSGNSLPVGWVEQATTETMPVYGPGTSYKPEAGDALKVQMTAAPGGNDPFPQRYALRTVGVKGNWRDLQTYFWGLGGYCRLMYMVSNDGGITYRTTQQSAGEANSSTWKLAVQTAPKNLGLTDASYVGLGTHQLSTDENFWDDIVSEGMKMPEASKVGEWKLY